MPSLGADMEAGTVVKWLIAPGDSVHRGDVVAMVETEKSTIDAEIFEDGVVESLLVGEGEEVPVGTPLALIAASAPARTTRKARARGEAVPAGRPPLEKGAPVTPLAEGPTARTSSVHSPLVRHLAESLDVDLSRIEGSGSGGSVTRADVEAAALANRPPRRHERASPFARKRARELGVDLHEVAGSGPQGTITAEDVQRSSGAGAGEVTETGVSPSEVERGGAARPGRTALEQQIGMRRRIAVLMSRSKREIPHYYLQTTIDFGTASSWLRNENLERLPDRRLLPAALLLKATSLAAKEIPEMNGFFVDDEFCPSEVVHLGVAISLRQGGLIAPAIHDVDRLSLDDLMKAMKDLIARARSGRLRSSEMADPTLTVTNLGDQGVETVFGVIYPPQVALVGFGKISGRPWAVGDLIGVRPLVTATLAADHRVSDGHRGARFLAAIDRLLQRPEEL